MLHHNVYFILNYVIPEFIRQTTVNCGMPLVLAIIVDGVVIFICCTLIDWVRHICCTPIKNRICALAKRWDKCLGLS